MISESFCLSDLVPFIIAEWRICSDCESECRRASLSERAICMYAESFLVHYSIEESVSVSMAKL